MLASHIYRVATNSGFIALLVALDLPEFSRLRESIVEKLEANAARHRDLKDDNDLVLRHARTES